MKFLIDADIPRLITKMLIEKKHDVIDSRDVCPPGTPDNEIYNLGVREKRIIVTRDLDFSNILFYPPKEHWGIIILRTHMLSIKEMTSLLEDAIDTLGEKKIIHSLVIIQKGRYRIRH